MGGLMDCNDFVRAGGRLDTSDAVPFVVDDRGNSTSSPTEWEPPAEFNRISVPSFPVGVFPAWLAAFVGAVAAFSQTPPDLAAMLALAALSAAALGRYDIEAPTGHHEPLCLYSAVALPPAERKSSVFSLMTAPLEAWERTEVERLMPQLAEQQAERAVQEKRLEMLKGRAAKCDDPLERANLTAEVADLNRKLVGSKPMVAPRLLADNVTPEALVSLLAEQGGRLALLSPEGGLFDILAGLYSDGRINLDPLLKAHDGEAIRVDRKGRPPEHVPRATLTLGLAVQPAVLEGLAQNPKFRGRGLLARFLFSLPASRVGHRLSDAPPIPQAIGGQYHDCLTAVLNLQAGEPLPAVLLCSAEALALFRGYRDELESRLAPGSGDLAAINDWAGKLAGALARVAGLLHLAEYFDAAGRARVSEETMRRALALGSYFIGHAKAAFALMGSDPEVERAQRVLRWLAQSRAETFTARNVFNGLKGTFKKMDALKPALRLLVQHGYILEAEPEPHEGPGRKPSPRYLVNPLWCPDGQVCP